MDVKNPQFKIASQNVFESIAMSIQGHFPHYAFYLHKICSWEGFIISSQIYLLKTDLTEFSETYS